MDASSSVGGLKKPPEKDSGKINDSMGIAHDGGRTSTNAVHSLKHTAEMNRARMIETFIVLAVLEPLTEFMRYSRLRSFAKFRNSVEIYDPTHLVSKCFRNCMPVTNVTRNPPWSLLARMGLETGDCGI